MHDPLRGTPDLRPRLERAGAVATDCYVERGRCKRPEARIPQQSCSVLHVCSRSMNNEVPRYMSGSELRIEMPRFAEICRDFGETTLISEFRALLTVSAHYGLIHGKLPVSRCHPEKNTHLEAMFIPCPQFTTDCNYP